MADEDTTGWRRHSRCCWVFKMWRLAIVL
jgi:hypothetical protein